MIRYLITDENYICIDKGFLKRLLSVDDDNKKALSATSIRLLFHLISEYNFNEYEAHLIPPRLKLSKELEVSKVSVIKAIKILIERKILIPEPILPDYLNIVCRDEQEEEKRKFEIMSIYKKYQDNIDEYISKDSNLPFVINGMYKMTEDIFTEEIISDVLKDNSQILFDKNIYDKDYIKINERLDSHEEKISEIIEVINELYEKIQDLKGGK